MTSNHLGPSFMFIPDNPSANMNLSVPISKLVGSISYDFVVVEVMYVLFKVLRRVPVKTETKTITRAMEHIPPVTDSYYGSP